MGAVGCHPQSLMFCGEIKQQGVGQCGTEYLQPWAGSVRNRVPALQSRQGAKSSQEDRADRVRAAGGGPGGSGRLCCCEQEGM